MKGKYAKASLWLFVTLVFLYCAIFGAIWKQQPHYVYNGKNGPVLVVEFHYSPWLWKTSLLWWPRLRFMESGFGFENVGYAAAYERSIDNYQKQIKKNSGYPIKDFSLPKRNINFDE